MSGEVSGGDNPLDHISPTLLVPLTTTFHHDYGYNDSIKTTLFPLLIVWEGFFYYIYIPDKKGLVSVERGETNVVSVLRVFYPLQGVSKTDCNEWTDILFDPQRGGQSMSLRNKDN